VWIAVSPGGRQHRFQRRDHGLQMADVVAEGLAEPAGLDEVAQRGDDYQRGRGEVERERVRLGGEAPHEGSSQVVTSMTDAESDTQPKTPPCMATHVQRRGVVARVVGTLGSIAAQIADDDDPFAWSGWNRP
jgi:hypothetical protein